MKKNPLSHIQTFPFKILFGLTTFKNSLPFVQHFSKKKLQNLNHVVTSPSIIETNFNSQRGTDQYNFKFLWLLNRLAKMHLDLDICYNCL